MNTYEFISALVDSLAWPISLVVIIFLLRTTIQKLLLNLSKFRFSELEIDFSKELEEITDNLVTTSDQQSEKDTDITEIAKLNPRSAILTSFYKIEHEINEVIKRLEIPSETPHYNTPLQNIRLISEYTDIETKTLKAFDNLRNLRNMAAHLPVDKIDITYLDALQYNNASEKVISELKNLKSKTK